MFLQLFRDVISLAGILISCQSTECVNSTPTAHHIFSCTVVAQTSFTCCQSVQSYIDPMHLHGSRHEAHCLRFAQNIHTSSSSRNVAHLQNLTPRTGTPSSPLPESVFQRAEQPCEDVKGMYPAPLFLEHLRYINGHGKLRTSLRTTWTT